jgi:nucleoside-diphosphate-sugar epimerase
MLILVTGAAGFIGANLCKVLLNRNDTIIGIDNLNDYYDVNLKYYRLDELKKYSNFTFIKMDLKDKESIDKLFEDYSFDVVVNLGAQAGVRYSIINPQAYMDSNMTGFFNILEACRHSYDGGKKGVQHLVYASSSSV